MTGQLRKILLVVVLLNLAFVQITGSVGLMWMLPLFALAAGAPLLWRMQRYFVYRMLWNVGLVGIFALLLLDIRRSGIRFMLEDGLILAAFCQVHVLNNLYKQKRPDLIFFNSFLIALVTGFFCQDVIYSVVFFAYAVVLIIGLSVTAASTIDNVPSRVLPTDELTRLIRRSSRQGVTALFFTALAFIFWPRDFNREGLVEERLTEAASGSEIAFSNQIRLDNKARALITNRIVVRARLREGSKEHVSSYWRGATFTNLQPRGWWADTIAQHRMTRGRQVDEKWVQRGRGTFERLNHRVGAVLDVDITDPRTRNLFLPMQANRIQFTCTASPNIDGNFSLSKQHPGTIHYSLSLNPLSEPARKGRGRISPEHSILRKWSIPKETRDLENQIRRRLPKGASDRVIVETIRSFLSEEREYFLPGETGAADNLRDFIAGRGGGHCEYFATTMVIMLRLNAIPCRMASGYLAHEWNEEGTELTIRSNHAHAWVEVWDPKTGWITVDPTPAQAEFARSGDSLFGSLGGFFHNVWTTVTTFDAGARDKAFAWAKGAAASFGRFAKEQPIQFILAAAGIFFLRRLVRRRGGEPVDPAVRDYLGLLGKFDLALQPGETPRQLLARARAGELPDDRLQQLSDATARHEELRYCRS